jgi:uncharacterized glyoxalase superfamily protein PhnB
MSDLPARSETGIVNRSAPTATVVPVLIYEDVAKAIVWLCDAFGFTERLRAARPDGTILHAQLFIREGAIMLGASGGAFKPPHTNGVNQYVIVRVDDVDRHFEHAKRFGAHIVQPPADMPFGERVYTAEDLGGHRWTFSQSIADVPLEHWGATRASETHTRGKSPSGG